MINLVIDILKANSTLTALVPSTRIYPLIQLQGGTIPAVVVQLVSTNPNDTQDRVSEYDDNAVQITSIADNPAEAWAISEAVRGAIDGYTGGSIAQIRFQSQATDIFEGTEVFSVTQGYSCHLKRDGGTLPIAIAGLGLFNLDDINNVDNDVVNALDRQALVYDEATSQWIADGVGQVVIPVRNPSRDTPIAVGTVLKATGAQGDRILVAPFEPATDDMKYFVGIASEVLGATNDTKDGHAQVYGELRDIDTDAFEVGDVLYAAAGGTLSTTENQYPIAIVTRKQANTGRIFIRMWTPGKGYHQRYRTQASAKMFVGVGATVELYYTATADGDGFVTQDLTAAVGDGNVEERVLRYKSGAFGESNTAVGYTDAGIATDATYAEMLTAFNNLLATESAPITIYATRTEVSGRSGLLADYPGAAAAYSLRLLDTDYAGAAIRVRRASDNAEQDIGFDGNGDLDTTSLATFCESNLYTSDFSINEDGLAASGATLTGNIDAFGLSDTLRFTVSATTGVKFITLPALVIGEQYRLSLKLYNPNTNTVVTGVRISNPNYANVLGASITTTNSWVNVNRVFTATSTDLRIFAEPFSIAGNGTDVIYFKDIQITQVTDGFVKVWYDQAGANDATQTTTTNQPKIYDSATGVVTENGKPAVQFDGTNDSLNAGAVDVPTMAISVLASYDTTSDDSRPFAVKGAVTSAKDTFAQAADFSLRYDGAFSAGTLTPSTGTQYLRFSQRSTSAQTDYVNTSSNVNDTQTLPNIEGTYSIGNAHILGNYFDGKVQEAIAWESDQSSNRTGIESNINTYYSIYS